MMDIIIIYARRSRRTIARLYFPASASFDAKGTHDDPTSEIRVVPSRRGNVRETRDEREKVAHGQGRGGG